jgi:hypothetical protein
MGDDEIPTVLVSARTVGVPTRHYEDYMERFLSVPLSFQSLVRGKSQEKEY